MNWTWSIFRLNVNVSFLGSQLPNSGNLRHSESVPNVMLVMITNLSPNRKIWLVKTEMSPHETEINQDINEGRLEPLSNLNMMKLRLCAPLQVCIQISPCNQPEKLAVSLIPIMGAERGTRGLMMGGQAREESIMGGVITMLTPATFIVIKTQLKEIVGGFECLELLLYGIRELA